MSWEYRAAAQGVVLCLSTEAKLRAYQSSRTASLIGPLPASFPDDYKPLDDRSHQRLGITFAGMVMFLERAGFLCWGKRSDKNFDKALGWKYVDTYQRNPKTAVWLNDIVGPLEEDDRYGLRNMTGYDVCDFLRRWLKQKGYEKLSVCEVILTQELFRDMRCHVKRANVFWSHIQLEDFRGVDGTLGGIAFARGDMNAPQLPERNTQAFWVIADLLKIITSSLFGFMIARSTTFAFASARVTSMHI